MDKNAPKMRAVMHHPGLRQERHGSPSAFRAFAVGGRNAQIMPLRLTANARKMRINGFAKPPPFLRNRRPHAATKCEYEFLVSG